MYICPTCDTEIKKPSIENNRPYCPSGHPVFNESASKGLIYGLIWGVLLVGVFTVAQNWVLAVPVATVGISLYKAWRLSRHTGLARRLSKSYLLFGIGMTLPMGLLLYPGSRQIYAFLGLLRQRFFN
jgi:hypothetical protein